VAAPMPSSHAAPVRGGQAPSAGDANARAGTR
jgi:hypothetical protein